MKLQGLVASLALLSGCAARWAGCDTPLEPINRPATRVEPPAGAAARQPSTGLDRPIPTDAARKDR
jgi:hypothetical protein